MNEVIEHLRAVGAAEYQWMFVFAGWAKGRQVDDKMLQAFAMNVFIQLEPKGEFLDWSDPDAVRLEFKKACEARKFPLGTDNFGRAVAESLENPLKLEPPLNGWIIRVANLAYCLQRLQPGLPFLIPVSVECAEQLGTSIRTLSLALNEAIRLGYVQVEEEATVKGSRRLARRLTFNPAHAPQRGLKTKRYDAGGRLIEGA